MTDEEAAKDESLMTYVKGIIQGQMFLLRDSGWMESQHVEVDWAPQSGTSAEIANYWTFTMPNGGVLKVNFSYEESPYKICKHCGRQIYPDKWTLEGYQSHPDGKSGWFAKDDDDWICPTQAQNKGYGKMSSAVGPQEIVHEPEES